MVNNPLMANLDMARKYNVPASTLFRVRGIVEMGCKPGPNPVLSRAAAILHHECSRIKWAWLRSLAVYDHLFVLKRGIKLARLSFTAI